MCDPGRRKEKSQISVVYHETPSRSEDRWSSWIARPEHARTLKFLEQVGIETTVLGKGYMVVGGELRGEKRVGLKPLLFVLAITYLCEVITQVHMKEGANKRKELTLETRHFRSVQEEVAGVTGPASEAERGPILFDLSSSKRPKSQSDSTN
jgi:hypothetical protein